MSNNSVVCNDVTDLHEFFWDGYEGKGEPYGLINLKLSRKIGLLGDTRYPDPKVQGYNPCAEQSLADKETCCLAEIFLPNITSYEEFVDVAKLLYRINKHSLALPCHLKATEEIVHANMRMGIGVTGVLQCTDEQKGWLRRAYDELRAFDKQYSEANGFPESVKLTTVKPSGTLSLLPGVTPGCHPAYARHMIRRIRISSNHPLVQVCRDHGYHVEYQQNFDGSEDHSTVVVSFPFRHPDNAVLAKDMTAIDQLETIKWLQENWSDNSVSCTVYYRKEELPEIRKYLKKYYKNSHKSLSFLLHSGHNFKQAPLTEITEEEYNHLVASTKLITKIEEANIGLDDSECANGACPVR
jgi:ribonucleotide reductase alpha subunit